MGGAGGRIEEVREREGERGRVKASVTQPSWETFQTSVFPEN